MNGRFILSDESRPIAVDIDIVTPDDARDRRAGNTSVTGSVGG
jgi:hypothetical protein